MALGCHERPVLDLLRPCVLSTWDVSRRLKDLENLRLRCDRLAKKLEDVAAEAELLSRMRVEHMGDMSLSSVVALPIKLGMGVGIDPPSDFFDSWPAGLRAAAARLTRLKSSIAGVWSVKQHTAAEYVLMLHIYCREATSGKASWRHIADLINAGKEANNTQEELVTEDGLRMQVQRLDRPGTKAIGQHIEALMKQYLAAQPDGDQGFTQWALSRNLAIDETAKAVETEDIYEKLGSISKERERLLAVPDLLKPESQEELDEHLRSLIETLRSA
jgi:hypothetical protein